MSSPDEGGSREATQSRRADSQSGSEAAGSARTGREVQRGTRRETGSLVEGQSGRLLRQTVALFAVVGGGYAASTTAAAVLANEASVGTVYTGGGAGVAAAATLTTVMTVGPLVAVGTGAWIGNVLHRRVTATASVATGVGMVAMSAVVFLFTMFRTEVLSSGSGGGPFSSGPSLGDVVAPLVGVVVVAALAGAIAAEVVDELGTTRR